MGRLGLFLHAPLMEEKRICKKCNSEKPIRSFELINPGIFRRRSCFTCRARSKYERNPGAVLRQRAGTRARNPATYLIQDSKKSDRKKNREGNDLDIPFVQDLILKPCLYCGAQKLRMTLDRIDNAKSHSKSNVNPCCIRCNLLRGDMPYQAWVALVPKIREIHEAGLFGDWKTQPMDEALRSKISRSVRQSTVNRDRLRQETESEDEDQHSESAADF